MRTEFHYKAAGLSYFATDRESVRLGIETLCDSWPEFSCS